MLRPDRALGVGKVERDAIVKLEDEWTKRVGAGRPSISARNLAEALWFEDQTMV